MGHRAAVLFDPVLRGGSVGRRGSGLLLLALCVASGPVRATDTMVNRAREIILSHKLLTRAEIKCVVLLPAQESNIKVAAVTVIEKHRGRCSGDPDTSPRVFDLLIDRKTGAARWDKNEGRTMEAIP